MGAYKRKLLLFCIFFIALFLRLYGTNWDQGWHLHPDERFLTMVGVDVKIPPTLSEYLDQHTSSFNPVNKGHAFFVYGTFPILINKVLAQFIYNDTYDLSHLQGRVLSAVADFFVVLLLFKLVELIEKKMKFPWSIKYLTAFFYAISVLPLQLSHFFAVDTFLNLFCWASLYFAVKGIFNNKAERRTQNLEHVFYFVPRSTFHVLFNMCLSGLFLGLALACKVSAILFAPLVGVFVLIGLSLVIPAEAGIQTKTTIKKILKLKIIDWIPVFTGMTLFLLFTYLALRLGSPYYFETENILNPQISKVFISSIQTLKSFDNPQMLFPPANQWVNAPWYLSPLNLAIFGVGPFFAALALIGYVLAWKKNKVGYIALIWAAGFFIFQSLQYAKTMRYLIFLYPFLALFAAIGIEHIFSIFKKLSLILNYTLRAIIYLLVLVWPLAFMSLYTKDHSRVMASKWIYNNIPSQSTLTYEYWDDPLPLAVYDPAIRNYKTEEIHIFDPDSSEKWRKINSQLNVADYYIMSSNRGWGSIPTTPTRYPQAGQFYKDMLANRRGFTRIAEFSSYPSLRYLGIPVDFPDQWAEEAFTVYDHPLVYIFKKNK